MIALPSRVFLVVDFFLSAEKSADSLMGPPLHITTVYPSFF